MPNKIEVDFELFRDLVDAAGWVNGFYVSLNNGETREYHPDWNSVEYLASEAVSIEQRGRAVLEAVEHSMEPTIESVAFSPKPRRVCGQMVCNH